MKKLFLLSSLMLICISHLVQCTIDIKGKEVLYQPEFVETFKIDPDQPSSSNFYQQRVKPEDLIGQQQHARALAYGGKRDTSLKIREREPEELRPIIRRLMTSGEESEAHKSTDQYSKLTKESSDKLLEESRSEAGKNQPLSAVKPDSPAEKKDKVAISGPESEHNSNGVQKPKKMRDDHQAKRIMEEARAMQNRLISVTSPEKKLNYSSNNKSPPSRTVSSDGKQTSGDEPPKLLKSAIKDKSAAKESEKRARKVSFHSEDTPVSESKPTPKESSDSQIKTQPQADNYSDRGAEGSPEKSSQAEVLLKQPLRVQIPRLEAEEQIRKNKVGDTIRKSKKVGTTIPKSKEKSSTREPYGNTHEKKIQKSTDGSKSKISSTNFDHGDPPTISYPKFRRIAEIPSGVPYIPPHQSPYFTPEQVEWVYHTDGNGMINRGTYVLRRYMDPYLNSRPVRLEHGVSEFSNVNLAFFIVALSIFLYFSHIL